VFYQNLEKCRRYSRHEKYQHDPLSHQTCFIIPEYINKEIVEKGTDQQRRSAWRNLILTEQLRGRRNVTGSMSAVFAVADKLHRTILDAQNAESLPGKLVRSEGGKPKG